MTSYHRAVQRMYADPRFPARHGPGIDLRAFFVTFAWVAVVERLPPTSWHRVKELLHLSDYRFRDTIAMDIPRYEGPRVDGCAAPMIRREGLCGKQTICTSLQVTDPADGTWEVRGYCSRHWDYSGQVLAEERERQAMGVPEPAPNAGGLLPVHFPRLHWEETYTWASGHRGWKPPAAGISADSWPALAPPEPATGYAPPELKVVAGGTAGGPDPGPPPEPRRLQLVRSWDDNGKNE